MKRLLTILLVAALAVITAACGGSTENKATQPATEAGTQLHTVPPEEKPVQLEWAPVDCELQLMSGDTMLADQGAIPTFALSGSTDEDCALYFTLDAMTSGVLQQNGGAGCYLTLDGEKLDGTLTFSEDCSEMTLAGGYSYDEMCRLATRIRGL